MPKVKKLPKWAIKQAGGINKKAWALARRGKGRKMSRAKPSKRPRRAPRAVGGASHGSHTSNKKGFGAWFKMGRTIDVFSGPAQGSVGELGFTAEAGNSAMNRYSAGYSVDGSFHPETAKATAGGIATGLLRNWFRSKLGIYRGLGQKKILSGVMAANPEILASTEHNPLTETVPWNHRRMEYDRGYDAQAHSWSVNPADHEGQRFVTSLGLDAALKVTQKAAEKWLNPMLPTGINF